MFLEMTSTEQGCQNTIPEIKFDRPEFFPCSECGREFTKLGLIYHKKTCTEKEDCQCAACVISGKVLNKPLVKKCIVREIDEELMNGTSDKSLQIKSDLFVENVKEKVLDIVAKVEANLKKPCGDLPQEPHNVINPSDNLVEDTKKTKENSQVYAAVSDIADDHGGVPCTRKLFCNSCKHHVFWESFGIHLTQHCKRLDNDYLQCPECPKKFSRPTMLLLHYFIHASTHPLDCTECHCSYNQCIDVTTRTVAEHCYAESYHCYICLKVFSHEQSIANHMRLHSKEMPFTCTECNRSFRQVGNLQRHLTTHRGDRPHQCPDCYRSFADPATLRNHMRVHTGETPYICTLCKRGFTQVGNLKRHLALHLKNEKPSSRTVTAEASPVENGTTLNSGIVEEEKSEENGKDCSSVVESMDFDDTSDENVAQENVPAEKDISNPSVEHSAEELNVNSKNSRGRKRNGKFKIFPCPSCNKIYTWKHDLQVHYRTHTGEKPYSCDICDKRFAQSGAVRTHLARHHSGKTKKKVTAE